MKKDTTYMIFGKQWEYTGTLNEATGWSEPLIHQFTGWGDVPLRLLDNEIEALREEGQFKEVEK